MQLLSEKDYLRTGTISNRDTGLDREKIYGLLKLHITRIPTIKYYYNCRHSLGPPLSANNTRLKSKEMRE